MEETWVFTKSSNTLQEHDTTLYCLYPKWNDDVVALYHRGHSGGATTSFSLCTVRSTKYHTKPTHTVELKEDLFK